MKVKVIENYDGYEGERPLFRTFSKGTKVTMTGEMSEEFAHWYPCLIEGHETFVPSCYLADGSLVKDYNPTEMSQQAGDVLEVLEIANAWFLCQNEQGEQGWIPAEFVVSC